MTVFGGWLLKSGNLSLTSEISKRVSGLARADSWLGRERLGVGPVRICQRQTAAAPHNNVERGAQNQKHILA
jgi:hypothetical protein